MSSETNSCEGQNVCSKIDQQHDIIKSRLYGDIKKTILQQGQGISKPQWESKCVIDISVEKSDLTPESENESEDNQLQQVRKNIEMTLGQSDSQFTIKVETCLLTMSEGEISRFAFEPSGPKSSQSANSEEEQSDNLPAEKHNKATCLTISLHSFSQAPPSWKLSLEEKYKLALAYKTQGTDLFQCGKVDAAFVHYSRAAKYLICIPELTAVSDSSLPELTNVCSVSLQDLRTLQCVCHLNLAACQAKMSNHSGVIENCTRALTLDTGSVKALYRRAVANIACGHKDKARSDLLRAQKLEPQNKAVSNLLQTCRL